MIECDSKECILANTQTCTPARYTDATSSGTIVTTVEGVSGNDCILYSVITKSSYPFMVGADLRCKVPKEYWINWATSGEFVQANVETYCEGTMLELT
jgi:hypothetical protein